MEESWRDRAEFVRIAAKKCKELHQGEPGGGAPSGQNYAVLCLRDRMQMQFVQKWGAVERLGGCSRGVAQGQPWPCHVQAHAVLASTSKLTQMHLNASWMCFSLHPGNGSIKARFHVGDAPMDVQAAVAGGAQVWSRARRRATSRTSLRRCQQLVPLVGLRLRIWAAPQAAAPLASRLQAVGVCTGIYTRQELVEAAPEAVVLEDLTDLQRVLATFGLD